jgi:hypothetical protein
MSDSIGIPCDDPRTQSARFSVAARTDAVLRFSVEAVPFTFLFPSIIGSAFRVLAAETGYLPS